MKKDTKYRLKLSECIFHAFNLLELDLLGWTFDREVCLKRGFLFDTYEGVIHTDDKDYRVKTLAYKVGGEVVVRELDDEEGYATLLLELFDKYNEKADSACSDLFWASTLRLILKLALLIMIILEWCWCIRFNLNVNWQNADYRIILINIFCGILFLFTCIIYIYMNALSIRGTFIAKVLSEYFDNPDDF